MLRRRPKARTRVFNALCPAMTNAGSAPRADGAHVRVAVFIVNNRPETMERIRPHVRVGSSHGAAVHPTLVSRAQRRTAPLRYALHRIRDTQASDAFVALFTFQTAQIFSFPRRVFASGFCHLTFTHPEPKGVGGAPKGASCCRRRAGKGASGPRVRDAARVVRGVHDALASRRSTVAISRHAPAPPSDHFRKRPQRAGMRMSLAWTQYVVKIVVEV
jgi:hypothetical protein